MPKLVYVGPLDEVLIPLHQVRVKRGEPFAVSPGEEGRAPSGDDPGEGLLAQVDSFRLADAKPARNDTVKGETA